ncbi:MAG TPA: phosphatidate cytidylyltransferase [Vicinamibacterales bacterium]|nr:phosphatidate cytidylyltransferase [Vicinamibacterales bacterium]
MTRVLSGAVLIVVAVAAVWLSPAWLFLLIAEALLVTACYEYAGLVRAGRLSFPTVVATAAAALTCASFSHEAFGRSLVTLDLALMTALVAVGALSLATWREGTDAVASVSAALLPCLYVGLPIGAMVAVREMWGPQALFLLMLTVIVSDSAQYYTGRAFGRRALAARISPKKTLEGAYGGFVFGTALLVVAGAWWLPQVPVALRVVLGLTVVVLGMAGDLFESMLKRSAGMKDSSALIPGHGGVLDRIDALLFAAPIYYVVLSHV